MVYAYIRVSTEKQTETNQRFEIAQFCKREGLTVDAWITETVSGTAQPEKRKLGELLNRVAAGDTIIATEISRFGRSLYMIMDILHLCMDRGCRIRTIKDGFCLGDDIQSKVLAFAFGLSAEIERNLISQRTKEALECRRAAGVKLGRPKGALGKNTRLSPYESTIRVLIEQDNTYAAVARLFHVDRSTMKRFCGGRVIKRPISGNKNPSAF